MDHRKILRIVSISLQETFFPFQPFDCFYKDISRQQACNALQLWENSAHCTFPCTSLDLVLFVISGSVKLIFCWSKGHWCSVVLMCQILVEFNAMARTDHEHTSLRHEWHKVRDQVLHIARQEACGNNDLHELVLSIPNEDDEGLWRYCYISKLLMSHLSQYSSTYRWLVKAEVGVAAIERAVTYNYWCA